MSSLGVCKYCELEIRPSTKKGEAEFVDCDGCGEKFHPIAPCTTLSSTEIRCFALKSTKRQVEFFCKDCRTQGIKATLFQLVKHVADLTKSNEALQREVRNLMDRAMQPEDESRSAPLSPDFETMYSEICDRERRSHNLILYNIEEKDDTPAAQRLAEDKRAVTEVLSHITNDVNPDDIKIARIGNKKKKNPSTPRENLGGRPIVLSLPNPNLVRSILRDKKNYAGPVKISPDRTIMQRTYLKKVLEDLKSANEEEGRRRIKYVNGVPKIVLEHEKKSSSGPEIREN